MTSGRTPTDVANVALGLLGTTKRILTLEDRTPLARTMLNFWASTRDEVLADHPWNEAIRRETLGPSVGANVPDSRYANAFKLPGDCLRWLPPREDDPDYFAGVQEQGYLLSDSDVLVARFIFRLEQVGQWSPGLEGAVAAKLAFYAAKPVTGQRSVQLAMGELYETQLVGGKRQDGLKSGDRSGRAVYRSRFLAARLGRPDYVR